MGFDFNTAQIDNNEFVFTDEDIAIGLLDGAEEILLLRKSVDERVPIGRSDNLRKRGYIQKGDIVNDPLWIMWPQKRTFIETRKDYNDNSKDVNAFNKRWKGSRVIVYVDKNATSETVRDSIEQQFKGISFTEHRDSNCCDIFVFEDLKNRQGEYRFRGAYKHMYKLNEQDVFQDDNMYNRYYFNNGILTVLLYNKAYPDVSAQKINKYPFIHKSHDSSNCQLENLDNLVKELDNDKSIKNIRLHIECGAFSYNDFIKFCNRLKMICEFFCVNIFFILGDATMTELKDCTKERLKDLFCCTNSIDSCIYAK